MPKAVKSKSVRTLLGESRSTLGMPVRMGGQPGIEAYLAKAAEAADHALRQVRPEQEAFFDLIGRFEAHVNGWGAETESSVPAGVQDAVDTFQSQYSRLQGALTDLAQTNAEKLAAAYSVLESDSRFVTIVLFGRTKAGKSTTMEALTGGNGASIGVGKQGTTKDVRAYYYPPSENGGVPEGPALRIVDTPGIDGFEGENLAVMAKEYVERSDHILFLLTDDKAGDGELSHFGTIRTQGKGVTVLLNVKAADVDLDLLVSGPELIFKTGEIEGHSRRICGYLARHFDMPPPRLIALHARAAWLGRSSGELPQGIENRDELLHYSRFSDVESRINEFICDEALPARLCAPRDLLLSRVLSLKDELRPFAGIFQKIRADIEQFVDNLERRTERARARATKRLPLLRARFQAASDAIPGMVDSIIGAGGRGRMLTSQWLQLLNAHGVSDAAAWFVAAGRQDFQAELAEEARVTAFDYMPSDVDALDGLLGEYHDADQDIRGKRWARIGIKTAGGIGAAALAAYAIANWWNPTGWLAAVGTVVEVGAMVVGDKWARNAVDEWERSDRKDLSEKRAEIIRKLRDRIWVDFKGVRAGCGKWLDATRASYLEVADKFVRPTQEAAGVLWQTTVVCLHDLDTLAARVREGLIRDLFRAFIPECMDGRVQVESVTSLAGYRTKIVVSASPGSQVNALGACLGSQGARIKRIKRALGEEPVDLVDRYAAPEAQVLQALGLLKAEQASVLFVNIAGMTTAHVCSGTSRIRSAITHRNNIQLAEKLLNISIVIEGERL